MTIENDRRKTDIDFERRLVRLEDAYQDLEQNLVRLNTTIALLNQTIEIMNKAEEKRAAFKDKTALFVVGGIISAVLAWIVRGGLGS